MQRTFWRLSIILSVTLMLCLLFVACSQSNVPIQSNGNQDIDKDSSANDTEEEQVSADNQQSNQGDGNVPSREDENPQTPILNPPKQAESEKIIGILKVKVNEMITLFKDGTNEESMLPIGEYKVFKMAPSGEHIGVMKYYISNKEYVYIDDSNPDIVEFIASTDTTLHNEKVVGILIVKEPDIILLIDDAAGTSDTVPAGNYDIIRKEETPYPDTFQFFISESQYFYLNDSAEEYVEYVENH